MLCAFKPCVLGINWRANWSKSIWNLALQALETFIFTTIMPMATKLCRVVIYHEGLPSIKSHGPLITWSFETTWQTKTISATRVPIASKFWKMVTYLEGLLPIKTNDLLSTWFWKITWQIKTIISPLRQCLGPPHLAG